MADNSATTAYLDADGAVLAASSYSGASSQLNIHEDLRASCALNYASTP